MSTDQPVLKLAKKLRKKYTKNGQVWDGGLADSLINYVGQDSTAEDALMAARSIMKVVLQQYKSNKKFRIAIDADLFLKDGIGKPRIKALKRFHGEIYNYYCPGYLEMLRMEKDPNSPLLLENVEYFEGLYLDEDWKVNP